MQLKAELRDLAFLLDQRGSREAADLAVAIAAEIDELLADESTLALCAQLPPPGQRALRNLICIALRARLESARCFANQRHA